MRQRLHLLLVLHQVVLKDLRQQRRTVLAVKVIVGAEPLAAVTHVKLLEVLDLIKPQLQRMFFLLQSRHNRLETLNLLLQL